MGLARTLSRGQSGLDAYLVTVEVHLTGGLPGFAVTGLPAAAVRESKDRVRAALSTSGYEIPASRITVHLGPADIPKTGGRFDLPIALGVLMAHQDAAWPVSGTELLGELALNGDVRPITGALPAVLAAQQAGHALVLPAANATEAALVAGAEVYLAKHLRDVVEHFSGGERLPVVVPRQSPVAPSLGPELADVRGQAVAKRALVVAAAGGHNLLMVGPPGSGKSMLAERMSGLLPPLNHDDMLRVASIASVAGEPRAAEPTLTPPFRAPHHTTSAQALVGGGTRPRPGEISLAHRGVLFLDELPEFSRGALEALREPLESGVARISRVHEQLTFPAEFMLVAAMNPCFCGYRGDGTDRCQCTPYKLEQYRSRISGPLLDRFDLHVEVPRVSFADIAEPPERGESSAVREAVDGGALDSARAQRPAQRAARRAGAVARRDARHRAARVAETRRRTLAAERAQLAARAESRAHDCRPRRHRCGDDRARRRSVAARCRDRE